MARNWLLRAAAVACGACALATPALAHAQLPSLPDTPRLPQGPVNDTLDRIVRPITEQLPAPVRDVVPEITTKPPAPSSGGSSPGSSSAPGTTGGGQDPIRQGGSGAGQAPSQASAPTRQGSTGRGSGRPGRPQTRRTSGRTQERRRAREAERARQAAPAPKGEPKSTVGDRFRDIAEVIPEWARAMLAALATLALGFGALLLITRHRARRLDTHRQQLLGELGTLQEALLPDVPEELGGLRVSVAYRPAEGLAAGGDFYDAFDLDGGRVGVIVGDVAGHGREALKQTAVLHYTLRAYLEAGMEPHAALQVSAASLARSSSSDRHATAVVAVYDPTSGRLTYASAGHPPPILVGAEHEPVAVFSSPPLGLGLNAGIRQTTITLPAAASLCFFTDGLEDVRVGEQTLGREGLSDVLSELGTAAGAADVIEEVVGRATRTEDDIAVCVLQQTRPVRRSGATEEQLILDADEVQHPDAERFLVACGVNPARAAEALKEARAMVLRSRAVILWTMRTAHGAEVEVLPAGGPGLPPATHPPARLSSAA